HMISFNQHVLVRQANEEVLWLNEAMSHLAEELGGLHYDSAGIDTTASRFFVGDLYNSGVWMADPANNAMVVETPPGTLEERGADPQDFPSAFPLKPDSGPGGAAATSGTLGAGSGAYLIATQPANGAGFQLVFRGGNGTPISSAAPQLAVARIR